MRKDFFKTKEYREKQRIAHLGKKHSLETKKKMSEAQKGLKSIWLNKCGILHPRWIKDRTLIKQYWTERNNPEYKQWRKAVWTRDNFKCKINNQDCLGRIEAHHILSWRDFPELNYNINNGITLCQAHHPRKREQEAKLSPYFQSLVAEKQ